jgi:hypothetical protein
VTDYPVDPYRGTAAERTPSLPSGGVPLIANFAVATLCPPKDVLYDIRLAEHVTWEEIPQDDGSTIIRFFDPAIVKLPATSAADCTCPDEPGPDGSCLSCLGAITQGESSCR